MIVYVDTSALVKLFVREEGSDEVFRWIAEADIVSTALIAYAEARAALARRWRLADLPPSRLPGVVRALDEQWPSFLAVEITRDLVTKAGNLAERHALRGYDAVHLAAALEYGRLSSSKVTFVAYDDRLSLAALAEGLDVRGRLPGAA